MREPFFFVLQEKVQEKLPYHWAFKGAWEAPRRLTLA